MKKFRLFSAFIVGFIFACPAAFARRFIDSTFEIHLSYSDFDQGTGAAGQIKGTIRRTDDHFACAITVNKKSYKCGASAAVDELAWLSVDLADYREIVSSAIDPQLPDAVVERIGALLANNLKNPMLIAGEAHVFKNQVDVYDQKTPDVLKITVLIYWKY